MQVGRQCRLEYRGIYVIVINFPALPSNSSYVLDRFYAVFQRGTALCFCLAAAVGLDHGVDHIVLQGGLSILQAKAESKTFFVRFETFAPIFIKQNNGLHNLSCWIYRNFRNLKVSISSCAETLCLTINARSRVAPGNFEISSYFGSIRC
jgi:hypothetical protein